MHGLPVFMHRSHDRWLDEIALRTHWQMQQIRIQYMGHVLRACLLFVYLALCTSASIEVNRR